MAESSRVFVLVHGAWHGGWCWRRVADRLRARGHVVYTPTLTGLADRSHLMSLGIGLDTHVDDVVNLVHWEGLENICLVGHSYGGFVISGVAEKILDRIGSFVFLDAFAPDQGESRIDMINPAVAEGIKSAMAKGEPGRAAPPASYFRVQAPEDVAWIDAMMTPHPNGTWLTDLQLTGARERVPRKTYIRAGLYPSENFDAAMARCGSRPGWDCYALPAGHDVRAHGHRG